MKKQFLVLTTAVVSFVIISCSKDRIEPVQSNQDPVAEQTASSNAPAERLVINPLNVNLAGSYQFNSDLKDQTRKLADGQRWPLSRVYGALFTYDRKGNANSALKFDGNYYVTIAKVPVQQKMSLSVWVKRVTIPGSYSAPAIVRHNSTGIAVMQDENGFWARVHDYTNSSMTTSLYSNDFIDNNWHHIVVTYADDAMLLYVDNQLQGKTSNTFTVADQFTKYILGYAHGYAGQYWKGIIDDLRFYNGTLTATDVQQLYNL